MSLYGLGLVAHDPGAFFAVASMEQPISYRLGTPVLNLAPPSYTRTLSRISLATPVRDAQDVDASLRKCLRRESSVVRCCHNLPLSVRNCPMDQKLFKCSYLLASWCTRTRIISFEQPCPRARLSVGHSNACDSGLAVTPLAVEPFPAPGLRCNLVETPP